MRRSHLTIFLFWRTASVLAFSLQLTKRQLAPRSHPDTERLPGSHVRHTRWRRQTRGKILADAEDTRDMVHIDAASAKGQELSQTDAHDVQVDTLLHANPTRTRTTLPGGSFLEIAPTVAAFEVDKTEDNGHSEPKTKEAAPSEESAHPEAQAQPLNSPALATEDTGNTVKSAVQALNHAESWVYTIDVKIGPEGKVVPLLVDTGSFTFWAASETCEGCKESGMVTALPVDQAACKRYKTAYGAGDLEGCLVETTVSFGPFEMKGITMAAATRVGDELLSHGQHWSGMFGLASQHRSETSSPMSFLTFHKLVDNPWVGFRLYRQGEGRSEIIFGDALTNPHANKTLSHVELPRVGSSSKYSIRLTSIKIRDKTQPDEFIGTAPGALLDTGTSNLVVPHSQYHDIMRVLSTPEGDGVIKNPLNDEYVFRCDTFGPDETALVLGFDRGYEVAVPWKDLVGMRMPYSAMIDPDKPNKAFANKNPDDLSNYCKTRVQSVPGEEKWILGDAVLVNVYHAVNTENGNVQLWALQ